MGLLLRKLKEQGSCNSPFYADYMEWGNAEAKYIIENQLPDGSFVAPWQWCNIPLCVMMKL